MNLILFERGEIERPLTTNDPRTRHVREVLGKKSGESFDCGLVNGPRGKARIVRTDGNGMHLAFEWGSPPPAADPVVLLIGLPRPQTARKILGEAATLGVAGIFFFPAEKSERSYASSHLWATDEVQRLLRAGVAQAFCTRIPACDLVSSLDAAIATTEGTPTRVALDNYESTVALSQVPVLGKSAVLAVGSERGWSVREREILREAAFSLAHLGPRVLRTETAAVAGLVLLKSRLGLL